MSNGFTGINAFGNLTKINYKELIEKYDADKNGELSTKELQTALKEENITDKIEISTIDTNADNKIDESEMAIYEQKYLMQQTVNDMAKTITQDFSGDKSKYLETVTTDLKNYITDYANQYLKDHPNDISGMAEAFKEALPAKYEAIKKEVLANDPSTFKSKALNNVLAKLNPACSPAVDGTTPKGISDTAQKKIGQALEKEMNAYIKAHPECTQSELEEHLNKFLNETDAKKMESAVNTFNTQAGAFNNYIDADELTQLKDYVKEFLTEALNNGVTVKLGGKNIATSAAITSALKGYTDGETLLQAMQEAIAGLSTVSLKDQIIAADEAEQAKKANENFKNIKGEAYKVDASVIDYSGVSGYYDNSKIITKGKSGHNEHIRDDARARIENGNLKAQMKAQITSMLEKNGISADKIDNIFENVYNEALNETLNGIGSTKINHKWLNKKKKYASNVGMQEIVTNFINTFNTKIAAAIDEMNKSDSDFDTIDLDFTQAGKVQTGEEGTEGEAVTDDNGNDLSALYASGKSVTTFKKGADYYDSIADKMIERMKSQMLTKAKNMCTANGVKFDESVFNTIFNNAKETAKKAGVSGVHSNGAKYGGATKAGAIGGAAGVVAAGGVGLAMTGTMATAIAAATGPIGWALGGVALLGAGLSKLIGSSTHSSSTLNTRTLLDTFAEQFKTNYTNWVEKQKTEDKK